MYAKITIETDLRVLTGMHIGGDNSFSAIGTVDSPVVRDIRTSRPIIPGSSLKGKIRTLLVRCIAGDLEQLPVPNNDPEIIRRMFGSSEKPAKRSRFQFIDAHLMNADELADSGITEVKYENTIDRSSSKANPRQIERVVSGAEFGVKIVYDVEKEDQIKEDMKTLARGLKLLQMDYLGGHGTRGSGRVSFRNFRFMFAEWNPDPEFEEELRSIFKGVEDYELLSV